MFDIARVLDYIADLDPLDSLPIKLQDFLPYNLSKVYMSLTSFFKNFQSTKLIPKEEELSNLEPYFICYVSSLTPKLL